MVDFIDLRLLEKLKSDFAKRVYLARVIFDYFGGVKVSKSAYKRELVEEILKQDLSITNKDLAKLCLLSERSIYNIKRSLKNEKRHSSKPCKPC